MGKTNNKNNVTTLPPSNKFNSNKNIKKGKENIIIRKTKADYESVSKKVKTLASDHFSASAGNTKMKEYNPVAENVSMFEDYYVLIQ